MTQHYLYAAIPTAGGDHSVLPHQVSVPKESYESAGIQQLSNGPLGQHQSKPPLCHPLSGAGGATPRRAGGPQRPRRPTPGGSRSTGPRGAATPPPAGARRQRRSPTPRRSSPAPAARGGTPTPQGGHSLQHGQHLAWLSSLQFGQETEQLEGDHWRQRCQLPKQMKGRQCSSGATQLPRGGSPRRPCPWRRWCSPRRGSRPATPRSPGGRRPLQGPWLLVCNLRFCLYGATP
mmetsp:Transcript_21107/g.31841  ORF Transcript_21107/g.31841 Transcript_21107/m.31841 type:complete len:233 (+) Transcript_21107:323-1021(+)